MQRILSQSIMQQLGKLIGLPSSTANAAAWTGNEPFELDACVLEDRLLYSATALPLLDYPLDGPPQFGLMQTEIDQILERIAADIGAADCAQLLPLAPLPVDLVHSRDSSYVELDQSLQQNQLECSVDLEATMDDQSLASIGPQMRHDLLVIDGQLDDLNQLIDQLQASYSDGGTLELLVIDDRSSGIEQVTDYLSIGQHIYSSVHIVSHAAQGAVLLGSDWVTTESLMQDVQLISQWQSSFTADADLLLYGCDLGATAAGDELSRTWAGLAGTDVAYSIDATGAYEMGGNWQLEASVGRVEAHSLSSIDSDWHDLLGKFIVSNVNDSGAGSLRQAIADANNSAGIDTIEFSFSPGTQLVIKLATALPMLTDQVVIDGTSLPQHQSTPDILLDGQGRLATGLQLARGSDGSTVSGLAFQNFVSRALLIESSHNSILSNLFVFRASSGGILVPLTPEGPLSPEGLLPDSGIAQAGFAPIAGDAAFIPTISLNAGSVDAITVSALANGNALLGNLILGDFDKGINLTGSLLPTVNDTNDLDTGANGLQNAPQLKSAVSFQGNSTITGVINTTGNTTLRVEFFANAYGEASVSGYGGAAEFLGATTVTTDTLGNANFSALLSDVTLASGATITATATIDLGGGNFGSTSEFAGNIMAGASDLMLTGSYVGNGIDDRVIAGLGFRPEVILIMPDSTSRGVLRTSTMSGDASKLLDSPTALTSNLVQALIGDGFVIGTNASVNAVGTTYHWAAFSAGSNLSLGTYIGNGTTKSITNVGFQPELVWLGSAGTQAMMQRSSLNAMTWDFGNGNSSALGVTALTSDGFSTLNDSRVNAGGNVYHYVAFNQSPGYLQLGSYLGNSTDNRTVQNIGFEPELVIVKSISGGAYAQYKPESSGFGSDRSFSAAGQATSVDQIQSLQVDGFQVGTHPQVNGFGRTYSYFAFAQRDQRIWVDTTSDIADGDTSSITNLRAAKGSDGKISLREAILAANASHNGETLDTIGFLLSGPGVQTINIGATALPSVSDAVFIDGQTQSGFVDSPLIELRGNYAGVQLSGLKFVAGSSGSTARGLIINRFSGNGIAIDSSSQHTIQGNWIGLDSSGTGAAGNRLSGISAVDASWLMIGGATTASRNLIGGNQLHGIAIFDEVSDYNTIQNNYIGLGADGHSIIGNAGCGIFISGGGDDTVIGGVGLGNVIVGNGMSGIAIVGMSTGTLIYGNYLGDSPLGGSLSDQASQGESGIWLSDGAAYSSIGGGLAGQGNTITRSGQLRQLQSAGVDLSSSAGIGNAIIGNSLYNNFGLGIDLASDGVSINDAFDVDDGANGMLNVPVISSATTDGTFGVINGSLQSAASLSGVLIHFYSSPAIASAIGPQLRQGKRYLGSTTAATDAQGNAIFSFITIEGALATGEIVTATTTVMSSAMPTDSRVAISTSEFSAGVLVSAPSATANHAPVGTSADYSISSIETLVFTPNQILSQFSDAENDPLVIQLVRAPVNGTFFTDSLGNWVYQPVINFFGIDQFELIASDGHLTSSVTSLRIVVNPPAIIDDGAAGGTSNPPGEPAGDVDGSTNTHSDYQANTFSSSSSANRDASLMSLASGLADGSLVGMVADELSSRRSGSRLLVNASTDLGNSIAFGDYTVGEDLVSTAGDAEQQAVELLTHTLLMSGDATENHWRQVGSAHRLHRRWDAPQISMLIECDPSPLSDKHGDLLSLIVEPVKWTVLSTGLIVWSSRISQVVATMASTAGAWFQFDPLTVIQESTLGALSVKPAKSPDDREESDDDASQTELMFDQLHRASKFIHAPKSRANGSETDSAELVCAGIVES